MLEFKDIHISKKVKKLLTKNNFNVKINYDLKNVINCINNYHKESWITKKYENMLLELSKNSYLDFELISYEIYSNDNLLIAGELGYIIGQTYTSLTGFFNRSKEYNNYGKLQMVLLSFELQKREIKFWNLGHAGLKYKIDLGAKILKRSDFLNKWNLFTKSL